MIIWTEQKTNAYKKILSEKEVLLILDYGNGKERWFKGEIKEGMTVLDVLETSSWAGKFNYTANAQLSQIDGLSNNEKQRWRCYLNEREIKESLHQKTISPKDKILCRYR